MRALVFYEPGGVDRLRIADVPEPQPGPSEVLIQIKASALNHIDLSTLQGGHGLRPGLPRIIGSDAAGIAFSLGHGVAGIDIGGRYAIDPGISRFTDDYTRRGLDSVSPGYSIMGENTPGTHCEYVVVPAANLLPLPDSVTYATAAAASLTFLTAWRMLVQQAKVRPGESVLILGAGSGLGTAAIQVARLMGGTVFATTRNPARAQRARELGAVQVIDIHDSPDWASTVLDATGGRGVDVVVESIGQATWTNSLNALARGGRMVVVGRTSGQHVQMDIRSVYRKQISIIGTTMGSHQDYRDVMALVFNEALRPVIDRVLPLERGVEALTILDRGDHFGKIVLQP